MGDDLNLAVTLLGDLDGIAEVANAAVNLDLLVQELLESRDIEDLVAGRLRGVDDELWKVPRLAQNPNGEMVCGRKRTNAYLLRHLAGLALLLLKKLTLAYCFTP